MNWIEINLTDISKPKQWKNLPSKFLEEDGYPVYGANGVIGFYSEYNHENPTLAITCRGATSGNIHLTTPYSYINSNAMALDDIDESKYNLKFLQYALITRGLTDVITGSAQPQITRTGLSRVKLMVPDNLNDQKRIAKVLSDCETLIQKRKESIKLLDEYLRSTFLEMFGDPVSNEKNWNLVSLSKHGIFKNGLNFSKNESGVSIHYLGVGEFKNLSKISNCELLPTLSLSKEPSKDYYLKDGDLVFVRSNGNKALVGRCIVVYPKQIKVSYSGFCIRYREESGKIKPVYLAHLFRIKKFKRRMLKGGRGANIQNLNQKILSDLKIPLPPLGLQLSFIEKVDKTESLKQNFHKSLIELENLYGGLSQKAFNGELDLSKVKLNELGV